MEAFFLFAQNRHYSRLMGFASSAHPTDLGLEEPLNRTIRGH